MNFNIQSKLLVKRHLKFKLKCIQVCLHHLLKSCVWGIALSSYDSWVVRMLLLKSNEVFLCVGLNPACSDVLGFGAASSSVCGAVVYEPELQFSHFFLYQILGNYVIKPYDLSKRSDLQVMKRNITVASKSTCSVEIRWKHLQRDWQIPSTIPLSLLMNVNM